MPACARGAGAWASTSRTDSARAELQLVVAYGRVLPDVCTAVQQQVADALAQMCGVEVAAVDVTVEELVRL